MILLIGLRQSRDGTGNCRFGPVRPNRLLKCKASWCQLQFFNLDEAARYFSFVLCLVLLKSEFKSKSRLCYSFKHRDVSTKRPYVLAVCWDVLVIILLLSIRFFQEQIQEFSLGPFCVYSSLCLVPPLSSGFLQCWDAFVV